MKIRDRQWRYRLLILRAIKGSVCRIWGTDIYMEEMELWQTAVYTDAGTREVNEDRVLISEFGNRQCIIVADGLGGHGGGSIAASTVVLRAKELFGDFCKKEDCDWHAPSFRNEVEKILSEINETVIRMQTPFCQLQSTCVMLWLKQETDGSVSALWAHVGDSRLYLFHEGKPVLRTRDHSLLEKCKEEGMDALGVDRSVLWQAMGEENGIQPDISKTISIKKEEKAAFLLCTDGFWEMLDENDMFQKLSCSKTPDEWLSRLKDGSTEADGRELDNLSAAAVFIGDREK